MITWLLGWIIRPEFFGVLAVLCVAGYFVFRILLQPLFSMACGIGAIVFAVLTAYAWADNRGYTRAVDEYQPKVSAAEKRAGDAEAANAELASNLRTFEATLKEQRTAVDRLRANQAAAQAATRKALAKAAEDATHTAALIERLRAMAASVTVRPLPADDAIAADRILSEVLQQRAEVTP